MYNSEKEFLKNYDSSMFEKLSVTSDILLFSVSDEITNNYRKNNKKNFSVLLVKRNTYPFKDMWCLPGGFIDMKETTKEAAERILLNETNLKNIYLEQLYTFDDINRDPRMRIISTSYMALVDKNRLYENLPDNVSWFDISVDYKDNKAYIYLTCEKENIKFCIDMKNNKIVDNKSLAFDHALVIYTGIQRLKNKIEYTDIVFHMMPKYFTLKELQMVYEVILDKKLLDPAFRRIIAKKVKKTSKVDTGKGHRPSALFEYKNE